MSIELHWIYIYGWLVVGGVMVKEMTVRDFLVSYFVALAWPVVLPTHLLRRILR